MHRNASLSAAIATTLALAAFSTPASAISTLKDWDGSSSVASFGCPNTTTYGQVVTIKNKNTLNKFTFEWNSSDQTGSMVVRGEVYAWDGSKASGSALWESKPTTISFSDGLYHKVSFKPKALPLTPNTQYVLFATIDKDFDQCTNNYTMQWGDVDDSIYSGGTFVYQNNGGDSSQWTISTWNTLGIDLAFKAAVQ